MFMKKANTIPKIIDKNILNTATMNLTSKFIIMKKEEKNLIIRATINMANIYLPGNHRLLLLGINLLLMPVIRRKEVLLLLHNHREEELVVDLILNKSKLI